MRRVLALLGAVVVKEVRENVRDRRTVLSALLFGPLLGPLLFAVLTSVSLDRAVEDATQPIVLAVDGDEVAPNLLQFLAAQGIEVERVAGGLDEARAAVREGRRDLVLVVPASYAAALRAGRPAPLDLVTNTADTRASRAAARVRGLLEGYAAQLAALRLQARGLDPAAARPLDVRTVDVSTPAGRSLLILGMVTYLLLFATLMGGLPVAIDATAGERERGSLEALLTLPVPRGVLIAGKILATCTFMFASLVLTVLAFGLALRFVPLERFGMSANFGTDVALAVIGVVLPVIPFGAALMTVVASFTRTYKEAQTWVALILLIPTLPILFAGLFALRPGPWLMLVPSLGQHLLITGLLRGEPLSAGLTALSVSATLVLGMLLTWLAARLYRREAILG